ncbi:transposon Tf2-9 polyprotein [Trichonephila clavipes]|nr:transposon Tf2-9 polyprotein [Trichonephila clavipes]
MSKKQLTPKIARWALFLEDFNYEIIHRPGKQMGHVDCLSRYPVMTITYDEITTKLANCQRNNEYINSLKTLLEIKQINDFVVKNDVLYKIENDNDVLVVPQQMQTEIVKNIHSKGHLGINKTERMAYQYEIGDIVAIQRAQFGTGLKLRPKFFGPYEVVKVKPKDRYNFLSVPSFLYVSDSPLVSMKKKRNKYRCGQRTVRLDVVESVVESSSN